MTLSLALSRDARGRVALFSTVAVLFLASWLISDPAFGSTETQSQWPYVLLFSVPLAAMAFAIPSFARIVEDQVVARVALIPAIGLGLSSVANIVEDGLHVEAAFMAFVIGGALTELGLAAMTVAIASTQSGRRRWLALIPAGSVLGVALYVVAGGPILCATWVAAAVIAADLDVVSRASDHG